MRPVQASTRTWKKTSIGQSRMRFKLCPCDRTLHMCIETLATRLSCHSVFGTADAAISSSNLQPLPRHGMAAYSFWPTTARERGAQGETAATTPALYSRPSFPPLDASYSFLLFCLLLFFPSSPFSFPIYRFFSTFACLAGPFRVFLFIFIFAPDILSDSYPLLLRRDKNISWKRNHKKTNNALVIFWLDLFSSFR